MASGYRSVFAHNLAAARREEELAQAALAEQIGVSTEFVSRLERGIALPSLETLERLCSALGRTPNDLLLDAEGDEAFEKLRALFRRANPAVAKEATRVAEAVLGYRGARSRSRVAKARKKARRTSR